MDTDSETFLKHICVAVTSSSTYDDTIGKRTLWACLLTMVCDTDLFVECATLQGFITYMPQTFVSNYGIVVFTVHDFQVSVNVLVPTHQTAMRSLLDTFVTEMIQRSWPDYAVDFRPVAHLLDLPTTRVERRVIPSRNAIPHLRIVDGMVESHGHHVPIHRVLSNVRDVREYTPLTTMRSTDADDCVYWHRFPCGTIATLRNPRLPMHVTLKLPPAIRHGTNVARLVTPFCRHCLEALRPTCPTQCYRMITDTRVPLDIRCFLVNVTMANYGSPTNSSSPSVRTSSRPPRTTPCPNSAACPR